MCGQVAPITQQNIQNVCDQQQQFPYQAPSPFNPSSPTALGENDVYQKK
jgi:hypothetical protein